MDYQTILIENYYDKQDQYEDDRFLEVEAQNSNKDFDAQIEELRCQLAEVVAKRDVAQGRIANSSQQFFCDYGTYKETYRKEKASKNIVFFDLIGEF